MSRAALVLFLAALPSGHLAALQCPDGSPPPCAGERPPAPPDPNRIAILPFHVTSADTLLGEGLAELLATEFTGESGPRAAHMGTVLRAWRRAGGDLRTPLGQAQAMRVAREIDVGRYVEGTVVGLGSRLTLAASVVTTADGGARRVGPVSGPADSLESLVGRLASGLLGATGRERQVDARVRLTDSPSAMRAYLEGLALFRRGALQQAARSFDRAFDLDSTFARAALMGFITAGWSDGEDQQRWTRQAWQLRQRLSPSDRVLLTVFLGSNYPQARSPEAALADRRRAVRQLPESPEAHYELGDYLFHVGTANDVWDNNAEALAEFERSVALDSQATVLRHVLDVGLYRADTALLRRVWPVYDRVQADRPEATAYGIVVAARTGDAGLAAMMAQRLPRVSFSMIRYAALEAGLVLDSFAQRYEPAVPAANEEERSNRDWERAVTLVVSGRPSETAALRRLPHDARGDGRLDQLLVLAALFDGGDTTVGAAAAARLGVVPAADSAKRASSVCVRSVWQLHAGEAPGDVAFLRRYGQRPCLAVIEWLVARREQAPDLDARLSALDSVLRWDLANVDFESQDFESLLLASVLAERGDFARAWSAVRLGYRGFGYIWSLAVRSRAEGRLAALAGDTTAAIRAYRRYLDFRRDAEPALIPQRDSVRAELARLERR